MRATTPTLRHFPLMDLWDLQEPLCGKVGLVAGVVLGLCGPIRRVSSTDSPRISCAALPLVSGLMEQGMAPGAGMAFLVAGGVSSLPAAIAVWALVKRQVFMLYLGLALTGSFASGLLFQLWTTF
jgi:uncharacterized membrane protein YraQ (UPF0718 family)